MANIKAIFAEEYENLTGSEPQRCIPLPVLAHNVLHQIGAESVSWFIDRFTVGFDITHNGDEVDAVISGINGVYVSRQYMNETFGAEFIKKLERHGRDNWEDYEKETTGYDMARALEWSY